MLALAWERVYAIDINEIGSKVVKDLQDRYQNKAEGCGVNKELPAFECSGIIARITGHGNYDPWNPSPHSQESGGVSFLYWRSDIIPAKYGTEGNGYIFNALGKTEVDGKIHPNVLCYFPINAVTSVREGEGGCGGGDFSNDKNYVQSSPCQLQGIYTAEDWYKHVFEDNSGSIAYWCGFNLTDYRKYTPGNPQPVFYQGIRISSLMWNHRNNAAVKSFISVNNEMIIKTWEQNIPDRLPIQAFFYWGADGRTYAMHDQELFYKKTKSFVPVIHVNVPSVDVSAPTPPVATFTYQPADQNVKP
ncbi:hypothetical protein [Chromobacterium sp. ATCC 53434]|uniref:hypothetical protein n=1 Tax=Chromobacterium sp. (strain ATCC 53434 / SC 14030) TaxID=2059672 RepID=UPI00130510DD|nr:hypothetical protein [Chromobacterium sp. ATCC 53434]